ncbi:hypothetical protein JG687_00018923 [Phytophthora cactorum]|uniref:Tc1-like transposase DDE domain-containing protein n=1 Tax=Phytophthora cactorum TaxID=29920 RepID=A0A8T1TJT9_9STRA|nr:hypothetical protein JG687_00018923 [Phytophthora cactorum]
MDGASYHKRQEDPAPTRRTLKADIQMWLFRNRKLMHLFFVSEINATCVKAHKSKPNYVANRIANEHGHYLLYTPLYHPELQPIEMVWGRVKHRTARHLLITWRIFLQN